MYVFLIFLILALLGNIPAQVSDRATITPGQQYSAGTRVSMPSTGISFVLPEEWLGGLPVGGEVFIIGSNTRAGVGLAFMQTGVDETVVYQYLNAPQDLGDNVVLQPVGEIEKNGAQYSMRYSNGTYTGSALALLGPEQNGVAFLFAGPQSDENYYQYLLKKLAASTKFSKPQTTAESQQWQQLLAGMMLKKVDSYYSSDYSGGYAGYSSQETLHLCRNGSYAYFSSSGMGVDGGGGTSGYGGGSGGEQGSWRVEAQGTQAVLILQADDGTQSRHIITFDGSKTFVDGERVYRVPSEQCP
jgi:hypothetical protein